MDDIALTPHMRRTLTVDNGNKWTAFRNLHRALGFLVYSVSSYPA